MISIIIPVYNGAKTIKGCLESIFNQTYQNFEVIIVNDGSTDNTVVELVAAQKRWPERIKVIQQTNQGAPAARNRGFKECGMVDAEGGKRKNNYVVFCDADIVMRPDMLEKMTQILEGHPEASYVYSSFKFGWKKFKLWPFDPKHLRQMPYIHTTSLIRFQDFPGWDESVKKLQDWDLWLTMLEQGHTGFWLSEVLFRVVDIKGTMSQWLPSILYKIPLKWLGIRLAAKERYNEAVALIKSKHQL